MRLVKPAYILMFCVLLVGCAKATVPSVPAIQSTQIPVYMPSATSVLTDIATGTPESFQLQSFCPEAIPLDKYEASGLNGNIILSGDNILLNGKQFSSGQTQKSILLFWNINSLKTTTYNLQDNQEYYYFVTSPNKENLAFTKGKTIPEKSEVIVLMAGAQEKGKFILSGDQTLFDWLNNGKLLVRQKESDGADINLNAVDLLTSKQEALTVDLPGLYSQESLAFWGALTVFDPSTSLVVYPQLNGDSLDAVLWDLNRKEQITSIVGGNLPKWSPGGKRLLIVADQDGQLHRRFNEIFIVTPEGKVTRSTFLKDHFENDLINLPVWSPDGRYAAFLLSTVLPVKTARLAILDVENSTVDLYCKEIDPFPSRFGEEITLGYSYYQVNAASPIWSPDSKYLLIEDNQQFRSNTYLVDLQNHTLVKIAEDARPVGWLK